MLPPYHRSPQLHVSRKSARIPDTVGRSPSPPGLVHPSRQSPSAEASASEAVSRCGNDDGRRVNRRYAGDTPRPQSCSASRSKLPDFRQSSSRNTAYVHLDVHYSCLSQAVSHSMWLIERIFLTIQTLRPCFSAVI